MNHTMVHNETKKGGTANGSTSDFYKNKADNRGENDRLSTFGGGGEPRSKKVDNLGEILTNLPKSGAKVGNPTYRVSMIGRRVLNYCGGFGVE